MAEQMQKDDLIVLYEDNHVIVVLKPQNVPSCEDETKDKDLLTVIKEHIKEKENKQGNVYVGLVHRLDRPTGGVMVYAKSSKAAARLSEQMQNGDFESVSSADPTLPEHWRRVGKGAARVENAVSGKFGAKVWHDGTLAQKIAVKAGVPVTLSFSARREPDEAEKPVPVGAIPLTGWSGETSLQPAPKAGVEALLPGKGKLFCSRQILVKPSTRYQLSFCYYSERSNLFYLELEEYDRAGRPLPRTDWMRHRDTFLRPDLSLRKPELQMELPFDTQPECASLRIEIRKLSAAKVWFWDFQLKEEKPRRLLEPEPFQPGDSLSMRGPDGIFYPDFTRAGVSERRPPKTVFAARDFGAIPGDDRDDAAGIQKAVDAAAKNGEGIVQLDHIAVRVGEGGGAGGGGNQAQRQQQRKNLGKFHRLSSFDCFRLSRQKRRGTPLFPKGHTNAFVIVVSFFKKWKNR